MKPDSPFIYKQQIEVESRHIDAMEHVNNIVYLQWVQEVAEAHWQQITTPEEERKYKWVVLRHEIDYHKPAFKGDVLTGRTWIEKMKGVKTFRNVEIRRGDELLVKALSTWVMLDADSGRIGRIPASLAAKFISRTAL